MKKFYRRGIWQILFLIIQSIFILVIIFGCVLAAVELYNDLRAESIVGLIMGALILAGLAYIFCCMFRSYITFDSGEMTVTANVGRSNPLVYKNQNAFALRYEKIEGLYLTKRTPNPATYLRHTPSFLTLVLKTADNNRYVTLHYYSDKQICSIIDLLAERVFITTGKRITDKGGAEMLAEYRVENNKKRGRK